MAKTREQFEVWSNAHVTGPEGSEVVAVFNAGTKYERRFKGVVAWSVYDGFRDASKILFDGRFVGDCFRIHNGGGNGELFVTGGFPLGGRGYSIVVQQESSRDFGIVSAYRPASIPGQSGSPIVDREGRAVGVVTLRAGRGKNAVGGMMPIDHWSMSDARFVSSVGFGDFEFLPLAPPPGS